MIWLNSPRNGGTLLVTGLPAATFMTPLGTWMGGGGLSESGSTFGPGGQIFRRAFERVDGKIQLQRFGGFGVIRANGWTHKGDRERRGQQRLEQIIFHKTQFPA